MGRAHSQAGELEKQVEKLKIEIETKNKEKEVLKARATDAERKAFELNSKVENVSCFLFTVSYRFTYNSDFRYYIFLSTNCRSEVAKSYSISNLLI